MKRSRLLFVAMVVSIAGLAAAQDAPQASLSEAIEDQAVTEDQVLTIDVDLVNVLVTATDGDGRYVRGLTAENFAVFEDHVPQEITQFEAETNLPLVIGLVVDASASVRDKLRFEQDAATEFFYSTLEPNRDRAMLIAFDSAPRLVQDFTDDPEDLSLGVQSVEAGGTTALYDAVWLAISSKMVQAQGRGRRILIVISDGADTESRKSLDEALEIAQRNDISIYAISTNGTANFDNQAQRSGEDALRTLAEETGGRVFAPLRLEELVVNFAEITEELRSQYALGYISTNTARDGTYREIRVESRRGGHRINARRGYYAPTLDPIEED